MLRDVPVDVSNVVGGAVVVVVVFDFGFFFPASFRLLLPESCCSAFDFRSVLDLDAPGLRDVDF